MNVAKVKVREYPGSNVRSYHTHNDPRELRLCEQDGFIFRKKKTPEEAFGVITFEEAVADQNNEVTNKIGETGRKVIRALVTDPLSDKLVGGTIVSHCQLNVEFFRGTNPDKIDQCVGKALQSGLGVEIIIEH